MRRVAIAAAVLVPGLTACGVQQAASDAPTTRPSFTSATAVPLTWGDTYGWPDGLAVRIDPPILCAPGPSAVPDKIERAVRLHVTLTNRSPDPVEPVGFSVTAEVSFNGGRAEQIYDPNGDCGSGLGTPPPIQPDTTYSYDVSYAVPIEMGDFQISLAPNFGATKAVFRGSA